VYLRCCYVYSPRFREQSVEQIIKAGTVQAEGISAAWDPDSFQASPLPFVGGHVEDNVFCHDLVGCLYGRSMNNITTPGGDAESMKLPVPFRGQAVAIHFMFVIPHYPLVVVGGQQ
jgi:hypothetical protein